MRAVIAIAILLGSGASFAGAPPVSVNPQLDPGVQGALPRYNADPAVTGHKYMPPKNTPALSLVEMFPWLYMDVDVGAQYYLYRETGNNTAVDVADPINLTALRYRRAPSNTDILSATDNAAYVDVATLNRYKCVLLVDKTADKCKVPLLGELDILGMTLGAVLDEQDYISDRSELLNRLQYDSCTNQMILPMGLNPNYVFNEVKRRQDDAVNESWCQPLAMKPVDCYRNRFGSAKCLTDEGERDKNLYDYRAWGYLRLAWQSVLKDAYTPSGGTGLYWGGEIGIGDPPYLTNMTLYMNAGIPALTGLTFPGTLQLAEEIPMEDAGGNNLYGDPFIPMLPGGSVGPIGALAAAVFNYKGALTTINDLAAQPYERIWDPTHPYSPRWDFKGTDRLFTALATITDPPVQGIGFSTSTSTCVVRCASVPVDILSFRLLAFTACMGCRIGINSATFWQEAIFLNTDIDINLFEIFAATCAGVDLNTAVSDTATDTIVGPMVAITTLNDFAISGIKYSRIKSNVEDYVTDISILGVPLPDCPSFICGGCHFFLNPGAFQKTINHDLVNTDLPGAALSTAFLKKPQKNMFDSLWPICSTKYDYQDATINIPQCAACTLISGDTNPLNGVRECCDDLAHALAPINTLKIRNTVFNPGLKPTPEGYTIREYFSWRDDTRTSPFYPDSDERTFNTNASSNPAQNGTWIGFGNAPNGDTVGYVGTHMPYMRWWDGGMSSTGVGTMAGGSRVDVGLQDYDPDSDCGAYDTIVGVGTEDWDGNTTANVVDTPLLTIPKPAWSNPPKYSTNPGEDNPAKYCRFGGNGFALDVDTGLPMGLEAMNNIAVAIGFDPTNFFGVDVSGIGIPPFYHCIRLRTINVAARSLGPDAMTSWDELKMYQMRSIQRGLNCLPQYEKMHKPYSSEEFVLNAAGGTYNVPILLNRSSGDDTDEMDPAKGPSQGFYKVPYKGAPSSSGGNLGDDPNVPGDVVKGAWHPDSIEIKTLPWPLSWRGYVSEDAFNMYNCYNTFPEFAGDGSTLGLGVVATLPCGADLHDGSETDGSGSTWTVPGARSPLGNAPFDMLTAPNWPENRTLLKRPSLWPEFWPLLPGGLSNAQIGDIVYLTHEDINYALAISYINYADHLLLGAPLGYFTAPMPFTAIVTATHTKWLGTDGNMHQPVAKVSDCDPAEKQCFTACESYVIIQDNNNGKFPDVCGNTDMYGRGQSRTIYREWMPTHKFDVLFPPGTVVANTCDQTYTTQAVAISSLGYADADGTDGVLYGIQNSNFGSCADPRMYECTYADFGMGTASGKAVNLWEHFRIYRPTWDIRQ